MTNKKQKKEPWFGYDFSSLSGPEKMSGPTKPTNAYEKKRYGAI